jgi:hypothetical protein
VCSQRGVSGACIQCTKLIIAKVAEVSQGRGGCMGVGWGTV